jgi:hypothetical protein
LSTSPTALLSKGPISNYKIPYDWESHPILSISCNWAEGCEESPLPRAGAEPAPTWGQIEKKKKIEDQN